MNSKQPKTESHSTPSIARSCPPLDEFVKVRVPLWPERVHLIGIQPEWRTPKVSSSRLFWFNNCLNIFITNSIHLLFEVNIIGLKRQIIVKNCEDGVGYISQIVCNLILRSDILYKYFLIFFFTNRGFLIL